MDVHALSWPLMRSIGALGFRISHFRTTPCSVAHAKLKPSLGDHLTCRTPSALHLNTCTARNVEPVRVATGARISKKRTRPSWLPDSRIEPLCGLTSSVLICRESSRICMDSGFGPPCKEAASLARSYWTILPLAQAVNIVVSLGPVAHFTSRMDSWSEVDDAAPVRLEE